MADTYTQLYYHIVFAVQNREALITSNLKDDLYRYITGIIQKQGQNIIYINGMPDHVHILISCKASIRLSDLVKEIKEHSSKFINDRKTIRGKFHWQSGYGAFTVSKQGLAQVVNYVKNQEEHHKKSSFREEYLKLLNENDVRFKEEHLFEFGLNEQQDCFAPPGQAKSL